MIEALKDSGTITVTGNYSTIPESHGGKKYRGAAIGGTMGYSYSAQVVEVSVDEETGVVTVDKVWVAHDCGKALNRLTVEGQVQGSVWMGMGQAMSEETGYHDGLLLTGNMLDYRVPTIQDSPPIEVGIVESNDPHGPFGAKEAGEGSLAAFLPALTNAIADAIGIRFNDLPVTPDRVFAAIEKRARAHARNGAMARAQGERQRLMDALPEFEFLRPTTLAEVLAARATHPASQLLGGGTDLMVNIRRGIVAPPVLIDMNGVRSCARSRRTRIALEIGASVTLSELAAHPQVIAHYPVVAQAAAHIAGPTHRNMGTVGGNLCLDTRCIFYNQSEWWRSANHHCLKTTGDICHVAPKSRGVCFATFSAISRRRCSRSTPRSTSPGRPAGARCRSRPLYRLCPPGRAGDRDARRRQVFPGAAAGRDRHCSAREEHARPAFGLRQDPHPQIDRISRDRRRGGLAAHGRIAGRPARRLHRHQPAPGVAQGTDALCGGPLDERVFGGLDALVRDQIMAMKTTFTPGHYRRRVAGVLARRLVQKLFDVP